MVSTRSRANHSQSDQCTAETSEQPKAQRLGSRIPTVGEQEQQLQADRAMIKVYRQQWQHDRGFSQTVFRHVRDVFWWLEHVCGVNMLDFEEKVVVCLIFLAVLVLIALGAYKQSTQLLHLVKQLVLSGSAA